jgi:reactive chlorine resistance protein C
MPNRLRVTDRAPGYAIAELVLRYGLVLVIAWIGAMKFTDYEAKGIQPLVDHSPLMSWMYQVITVSHFSKLLGLVELTTAALILMRPLSARACTVGSLMAIVMFLVTLTFLFSTPGWEPTLGGFPALSAGVGQFLLKDVVLLGAAMWSFAESRHASQRALGT